MIIYHDTSYVKPSNAKWIAKGYAMEDIYSLRLQFLYTEAQQEENRMAHAAGIRDTVQLRQAAEHRNTVMAPIMADIAHNFICYGYTEEEPAPYSQATRLTVMNACMDRIEAVLAQSELPDRGREALPKAGSAPEVEFRNVTFAYGEKEVLHDVSFTLEKNRMLALVGPSGGGKSTVANLLSRFWDVKQGQILVRGRDIRDIPLSDLMDQISMVFQRVYLFQDTVYNNIAMGRTDATREEVYEAARKARCYDFIMELPDGFDTVIGEGGASLSGGERQRISIARCILKDAPIVILDEATASVDADNESYIQEAITQLCRGKTLLVIAHRLNTIRHADEILVIDQGRIVQAGDHDKLMAEEGIYRRFITARSNPTGWCR